MLNPHHTFIYNPFSNSSSFLIKIKFVFFILLLKSVQGDDSVFSRASMEVGDTTISNSFTLGHIGNLESIHSQILAVANFFIWERVNTCLLSTQKVVKGGGGTLENDLKTKIYLFKFYLLMKLMLVISYISRESWNGVALRFPPSSPVICAELPSLRRICS